MKVTKVALFDPLWVRYSLTGLALLIIGLFLCLPLCVIFVEAFAKGWQAYGWEISHPNTLAAIRLTLLVSAICLPLSVVFGVSAAWSIARFEFVGKGLLTTLIDLPFSVSPVTAGLLFVLLFGANGWFGEYLRDHDMKVIFAVPGIVLATLFITCPFVARELIPLMQEMGSEEEEAALSMGAGPWTMFFKITLPNIKWGLLYGVVLCNARAMGEFGAVSVVSGHIAGLTNTLPLHVEATYNEYNAVGAFAAASLLTVLAVVTLVVKSFLEWKQQNNRKRTEATDAADAAKP